MNGDIGSLRVLVALADEGTFTDAAAALGRSQATASRALASLEQHLGVRLVERTTRSLQFTAAGLRVVEHARRLLVELDRLDRIAHGAGTELRVGYAWAALGERTALVLQRWQSAHHDTELVLVQSHSRTAGLLEGGADIAVLRRPVDDRRLKSVVVGVEPRMGAVASSHPLARKRSLRLSDFDGCTIAIDTVTGTTTEALWPAGSGPRATHAVRSMEEWLNAVATGKVLGMTAAATAWQHPRPGISYRQVVGTPPVAVTIAWRAADPPPLAQAFAALVSQAYAG
jgi:DNA-binding transcriptional LysR family regulator